MHRPASVRMDRCVTLGIGSGVPRKLYNQSITGCDRFGRQWLRDRLCSRLNCGSASMFDDAWLPVAFWIVLIMAAGVSIFAGCWVFIRK